jgi:serine/threonine-protein kinase
MCPELVRGQLMDQRGDIYSVGVMLFELLTGRRPFEADTPDDLMRAHLREPPPKFGQLNLGDQIPPAVESVVQSCLAKSPDDRPASARELAHRFLRAIGANPMPMRSPLKSGSSGLLARPNLGPAVTDRNTFRHSIDAVMPEAMALVKIKGFIHDLGGNVLESVPGLIKVRLPAPQAVAEKKASIFGRGDAGGRPVSAMQAIGATDMELHMEREDPSQPSRLTVTLLMRPAARGIATPAWRTRCSQIGRDLQAYLMGR